MSATSWTETTEWRSFDRLVIYWYHKTYPTQYISVEDLTRNREKLRATKPGDLPGVYEWRSEDFERKKRKTNVKHITMETLTDPPSHLPPKTANEFVIDAPGPR